MRACVIGAGAVGGHLAGRLGASGADVSVLARGAHLSAIRKRGLRVKAPTESLESSPRVSDQSVDLGPQDLVFVAVKAPSLPSTVDQIVPLLHDDTLVVFATNGIPWWYFQSAEGPWTDTQLPRLDPSGRLWREVGPNRVVGAVAYMAGTVVSPGIVRAENSTNRLVIGRPDGAPDERLSQLAESTKNSGLDIEVTTKIRDAVWKKLVSNLIGGALGCLAASPTKDVLDKSSVAHFADAMGHEVMTLARALGSDPGDLDPVLAKLRTSGHVQSIVQDLLAGRPMEIDALLRAPMDLAELTKTPVPHLELIIDLVTQRARAAGLY